MYPLLLRGVSGRLLLSLFWCACSAIFLGHLRFSAVCHAAGDPSGVPYEPLRTCEERFLAQKTLFLLALASAKRIGELHALSYRVSHTRDWGEVSFAFVTGFVAKTQDPSSLAPRFEGFTVPALPNARKNRNGRLLCPVRAVKVYLDRTASHRPRCERLFVTAGRSKKEIAKTTVSFWLRKTISRAYELSGTALPVPAP